MPSPTPNDEARGDVPGDGPPLSDVQAVIESARIRGGMEMLEHFIRKRLVEAEDAEVKEAAEVAREVIESIPVLLARARQKGAELGLQNMVGPLLDHAEQYFLQPVDLIPEMTQGLAGLLDDSYLFIRVLQHLDEGPDPFLDWDLEYPRQFLSTLIGSDISRALDAIVLDAMQQMSTHLNELWTRTAHSA